MLGQSDTANEAAGDDGDGGNTANTFGCMDVTLENLMSQHNHVMWRFGRHHPILHTMYGALRQSLLRHLNLRAYQIFPHSCAPLSTHHNLATCPESFDAACPPPLAAA
jgi:hypothetical protein